MGREWYWSRSFRKDDKQSPGCISTVLHLFDFHQFQYTPQQHEEHEQKQPFHTEPLPLDPPFSKGVEAPRNSLQLEGDLFAGNSSAMSEEDDIPVGIPIVNGHSSGWEKDSSSETGSLQGSTTPNLVARLMGLDLLPDRVLSPKIQYQPSSARLKSHQSCKPFQARETNLAVVDIRVHEMGSRSLPDTPRISSARRSDVDHRLSLQLKKEDVDFGDFSYLPFSSRNLGKKEVKFHYEANPSPSRYACEIVKQVKESVSRRVGVDITNIATNNRFKYSCSNGNDALTFNNRKAKRSTKSSHEISPSKHTQPSCSPRLRFLDAKSKQKDSRDQLKPSPKSPRPPPAPLSSSTPRASPASLPSSMPRRPPSPIPPLTSSSPSAMSKECTKNKSERLPRLTVKFKKASCEQFTQRSKKPSTNTEKKCKPNPIHTPPYYKSSQTQKTQAQEGAPLRLSCASSPPYQDQAAPLLDCRDDSRRTAVTFGHGALAAQVRWYIGEILQRTGIYRDTLVSFTTWFSPAHPLHPTIFHHLERCFHDQTSGPLNHRCKRRLLFNLVNEILREALRQYLSMRPWALGCHAPKPMMGQQLVQLLWSQVSGFPLANCRTLEDIDALVEKDLAAANGRSGAPYGCCWNEVVLEMGREILDSLVHEETMLVMWGPRDY